MKSIQLLEGGELTSLPALQGPIMIEVEPNHYIDITRAIEFDDDPSNGQLLVIMPAPTTFKRERGPHSLLLEDEPRELALAYIQYLTDRSRQLLRGLL